MSTSAQPGSPVRKPPRTKISPKTRMYLFARSAGRCEFDGCPEYLLEHYPTFTPGVFGEMAHVYAFSEGGPRGHEGIDPGDVDHFSNLMLLCPQCHKLVDNDPGKFPVEVLRKFKEEHENLVYERTGLQKDSHTVALTLMANIGDRKVGVTQPEIQQAVAPLYVGPRSVHEINLTNLNDQGTPEYWKVAEREVSEGARRLYEVPFDGSLATNISVFALAPIPLLILLGSQLSDKITTRLFQRHRDTEAPWCWKNVGAVSEFGCTILREGTDPRSVALVVSMSGRVAITDLPPNIDGRFTVFELLLTSEPPGTGFLRTRNDLEACRDAYRATLRRIAAEHSDLLQLQLFPAVPAPVAVAMGLDVLAKRDPALVVYDYNKNEGGFVRTLEVK